MRLEVLTPEKKLFEGNIIKLIAAAEDGEIGIYPGHAPLATLLAPGPFRFYLENGEKKSLTGKGGCLFVDGNRVSVLLKTD